MHILSFMLYFILCEGYLDIGLYVQRNADEVSYSLPVLIDNIPYDLTVSLQNKEEYILVFNQKVSETRLQKMGTPQLKGFLMASSLEGYTFQGWKRFFIEAFFSIQQKYQHKIPIDFTNITTKQAEDLKGDGVITFGPKLLQNNIYQQLKANSEYITENIISFYRGANDDHVFLQLGGYEQNFASGHSNGILFSQFPLKTHNNRWQIPIKSINLLKEQNGKDEKFYIANSECNLDISIQSSFMILPVQAIDEFQRNVESSSSSCKVFEDKRFGCYNMTLIELSLTFIELSINQTTSINISLYDLRQTSKTDSQLMMFMLKFEANKYQIGDALLKNYYISIDMDNDKVLYSPVNRFPTSYFNGVYLIRFVGIFGLVVLVVGLISMIWQAFTDPLRKKRIRYGHEGIRLVPYRRNDDDYE